MFLLLCNISYFITPLPMPSPARWVSVASHREGCWVSGRLSEWVGELVYVRGSLTSSSFTLKTPSSDKNLFSYSFTTNLKSL